jgi:hypothetical protein
MFTATTEHTSSEHLNLQVSISLKLLFSLVPPYPCWLVGLPRVSFICISVKVISPSTSSYSTAGTCHYLLDRVWNVLAHAQKPDFVFRRNRRVHLNSQGASVQSTTDSRGVRISCSNAGYTMFRGSVKGTGYPLHSPIPLHFFSRASPCAITFRLNSIQAPDGTTSL